MIYLHSFNRPLFHVFVAEVASEIIGIALYYYRYLPEKVRLHLEEGQRKKCVYRSRLSAFVFRTLSKQV
jgi:hypothetical protein